jgi:hypothetical protein
MAHNAGPRTAAAIRDHQPPRGTYKLFDPSGNIIMSGNFVDIAERHIPDSVARREARADAFKIEARAEAAARRSDEAVAELASLLSARVDALVRRADALMARDRKRRKDVVAKAKARAEAEIQRQIDSHPDPDEPSAWSWGGGLTPHAAPGPIDRKEQRERVTAGDDFGLTEKPLPLDEAVQTGPAGGGRIGGVMTRDQLLMMQSQSRVY